VRWWLLREPAPVGTCDFTDERLVARFNSDLANAWGNLASRSLALARRRDSTWPNPQSGVGDELRAAIAKLPARVDEAVARYDLRAACEAIVGLADAGNRFIEAEAPWHLATAYEQGDVDAGARFVAVIDVLIDLCHAGADELAPFVPDGARRLSDQLDGATGPAFPRIDGSR
jgi:methionyl-tRNA synthetase